ncbi:hypothetical protein JCM11251_002305 [Rhodosporidiobolus azoricus]
MSFQPPGSNPHTSEAAVPFASLRPGAILSSLHRLEGHLVSISPDTGKGWFTFTLASTHKYGHGQQLQIRFEGGWAKKGAQIVRSGGLNKVLVLSAKNGAVETRPLPKDKIKDDIRQVKQLRVVFREGISGAWRGEDGKKVDKFFFKGALWFPYSSSTSIFDSSSAGGPPSTASNARSFGSRGFPLASSSPPQPVASTSAAGSSSPRSLLNVSGSPAVDASSSSTSARLSIPQSNAANPYVGMGGAHPSTMADLSHAITNRAPAPAPAAATTLPTNTKTSPDDSGYEGSSPSRVREQEKGKEKEREEPPTQPDLEASSGRKREASRERGARAEGKKKKRREKRTTWGGLTVGEYSYLALSAVPDKNCGNQAVIAMAVVTKDPYTTRNGDWSTELRLFDPTAPTAATQVNYFASTREDVPQLQDGDIVVLQRINWSKDKKWFVAYKGKGEFRVLPSHLLLSDPPTPLSAFPPGQLSRSATIGESELDYARDLAKWSRKHDLLRTALGAKEEPGETEGKRPLPPKRKSLGRPVMRVEEMEEDTFCDTYGEIVKYFIPREMDGGRPERNHQAALWITDYTSHPDLDDYPSFSECAVYGKRVLQVAVFGVQNEPLLARNQDTLRGKIVKLRNLRPKSGGSGGFEATMVEDSRFPQNRDVSIVTDLGSLPHAWYPAFKKRRDAYWKLSRVEQERPSYESTGSETAAAVKEEAEQKTPVPLTEIANLRALRSDPQSLSASLALSSPGTYHMRVRVVDYYPSRLEDWVFAWCPDCARVLSSSETTCIDHDKVEYEWGFRLALADACEECDDRLYISVEGEEATSLFPSFSPSDFASLRSGDTSALLTRLRGMLGALDTRKRHRQPVRWVDHGPEWDALLEADKQEKDGKINWSLGKSAERLYASLTAYLPLPSVSTPSSRASPPGTHRAVYRLARVRGEMESMTALMNGFLAPGKMSLTVVLPRLPLNSRFSFEAEDGFLELDELMDLTAFMSGEDRRAGGDGSGYFGSSTLKATHNLPFPTFGRFAPPLSASSPFSSAPRRTLPFPSSVKRPAVPPPVLLRAGRATAELAERKTAHRRSLSTPDSLLSVSLALASPSSRDIPSSRAPAISPNASGDPRFQTSSSCTSSTNSSLSPHRSSTTPSFVDHLHLPNILRRQRSIVHYNSTLPFSPFSIQRPTTPEIPCRDLAATAVLLREAEVCVLRARVEEEAGKDEVRQNSRANDLGKLGSTEVRVDGVVFEVLPTIVIEQGLAV